ncbi:hypothetical protein CQJ30_11925 [Caldibacillus thermoamylovorans]|nr:hypothetical protein CQJ30_11925 [Caldibacillus thermoamylovorans]
MIHTKNVFHIKFCLNSILYNKNRGLGQKSGLGFQPIMMKTSVDSCKYLQTMQNSACKKLQL